MNSATRENAAAKSKVLTLNLRNRMIFRAADEGDAVQAADFLGKERVVKRSWGYSAGNATSTTPKPRSTSSSPTSSAASGTTNASWSTASAAFGG